MISHKKIFFFLMLLYTTQLAYGAGDESSEEVDDLLYGNDLEKPGNDFRYTTNIERGHHDEFLDACKDFINKLRQLAKRLAINTLIKHKHLLDYLQKNVQHILGQYDFDSYYDNHADKIEDEFTKATLKDVDVSNCKEMHNEYERLPDIFIGKIDKCADKEISKGGALIKKAAKSARKGFKSIDELNNEYYKCEEDIDCYLRLSAKILAETAELPERIAEHAGQVLKFVHNVPITFKKCASHELANAKANVDHYSKQIIQCIDSKLYK